MCTVCCILYKYWYDSVPIRAKQYQNCSTGEYFNLNLKIIYKGRNSKKWCRKKNLRPDNKIVTRFFKAYEEVVSNLISATSVFKRFFQLL